MKFDTPGQNARLANRLNAEFDRLSEPEKEAVLRMASIARMRSGAQYEYLPKNVEIVAVRRSDNKIAWGVGYLFKGAIRGVFPE